jgi:tripartite-type tricarboxylate transporter receptor subunit TctC
MKNRKREICTSGSVRDEAGQPSHLLGHRTFLRLAACAAALPAIARIAKAQSYPTRPVRIIVPYAPGGTSDISARLIGQWLSERLGQQFVVENRPGSGTNLGTEAVVRATPDGTTLLLVTAANAINATLYEKLNFVFLRDIVPVGAIIRVVNVLEVHPSVPVNSVPELIAYAKASPGKLNVASAGNGSPAHVSAELFKMMTGVNMVHVPYRGAAPALSELLAGQVQVLIDNMPTSIEHVRAGRVRGLGVTSAWRSDVLPTLPAIAEFVPGYEATSFFGIGAPRGTPMEIVELLNTEIKTALRDGKFKARIADLGATVFESTPTEFSRHLADETEKWGKVVKFSGAKAE